MSPLATRDDLHVALVQPEIHWNAGNAGRTCLAWGAQLHLVRPLGFSLADRRVRRAGLDYWPRVEPRVWDGLDAFESALPELGDAWFFSADTEREFWSAPLGARTVLVFGAENAGLPRALRERHADRLVKLPMSDPHVRSLNLSTCVAVAIYEVLRRRWSTMAE